ncbi:MAG: hypothetical protein ACI9Y1_001297 [Lentisphaeria bacterium]|jgi:hypothetical protein
MIDIQGTNSVVGGAIEPQEPSGSDSTAMEAAMLASSYNVGVGELESKIGLLPRVTIVLPEGDIVGVAGLNDLIKTMR